MRDDVALARLLLHGWLEPEAAPELDDPLLRGRVEARLAAVDHELTRTEVGWAALPRAIAARSGWRERHALREELERAVLCLFYVYLVFLPAEDAGSPLAAEPRLSVDELARWSEERGLRTADIEDVTTALTAAGFARRAERQYQPGPALLAMADRGFHEMLAERLMRERLRRGAR